MNADLLSAISKVDFFPSMPGAAAQVLSLLDDPNATALQIEETLKYDPGLTGNFLKMVNSAYFGFAAKVSSVKRAVVLLGMKRVVQIVITSCMSALMRKQVVGYDLPPGELWRHSIAVSVAAEGLMNKLEISAPEGIFAAALLHDVGKLVLGDFIKEDIRNIEEKMSEGTPFQTAEYEMLGTNHAEIGAHILDRWSLPQEIVNAVRWHHDPELSEEPNTLIDIVHVADVLCLMIGIGVGREGLQYKPSQSVAERLKLKAKHIEMVASQTLQRVNELTDVMDSG